MSDTFILPLFSHPSRPGDTRCDARDLRGAENPSDVNGCPAAKHTLAPLVFTLRSTSKGGDDLCIGVVAVAPTCFGSTDTSKMWSRVSKVKMPDGLHWGNHVKMFARRRPQQSVAARAHWQLSRLPPLSLHLRLEVKAKELSQRVFAVAKVCSAEDLASQAHLLKM